MLLRLIHNSNEKMFLNTLKINKLPEFVFKKCLM